MKKFILFLLLIILSLPAFSNEVSLPSKEEIPNLTIEADKGSVDAQKQVGLFYYKNNNLELAEKYLKLAADKGLVEAQDHLGLFYYEKNNFILAEKYFKLAADKDYDPAQDHLGLFYFKLRKLDLAEKYLTLAANKGSVAAEGDLFMINMIREVGIDSKAIVSDLSDDDTDGLYNLGDFYYQKGDFELAKECLEKALKSGSKDAQILLDKIPKK